MQDSEGPILRHRLLQEDGWGGLHPIDSPVGKSRGRSDWSRGRWKGQVDKFHTLHWALTVGAVKLTQIGCNGCATIRRVVQRDIAAFSLAALYQTVLLSVRMTRPSVACKAWAPSILPGSFTPPPLYDVHGGPF
ncbi:hypothetical protein ASPBRDRAFT_578088 [Aspergillus brasiliensis CBS 101740]|uniref:Uncharacterized protein n=1 Tax=Aspergillus brasiliensis (strain CBS 101740 / IMI 381727 / IBT 21946) TaxID=767769 RepID=A0A1L9UJH5_ASPBC|nr:hypothetical protein ASPBRDRAFT_578088 [Aspergillus brasiliensis CBS 101740]